MHCRISSRNATKRWLSEIHEENSQDEENTLTCADLPEIPPSRPKTEMIEDPETGATMGDMEDNVGREKVRAPVTEPHKRDVVTSNAKLLETPVSNLQETMESESQVET
jgi:hypothetical protein